MLSKFIFDIQYHNKKINIFVIVGGAPFMDMLSDIYSENVDDNTIFCYLKTENVTSFIHELNKHIKKKKENKLVYNRGNKVAIFPIFDVETKRTDYEQYIYIKSNVEIPLEVISKISKEINYEYPQRTAE